MNSKIYILGIFMGLFILNGNHVFSQPRKGFDLRKLYDIAIEKYLLHSKIGTISMLYLEKPSFEPEYSIRVIEFKDSIRLEGNFFQENYFGQLVLHLQKFRNSEFEPEVGHYSILVSKTLNEKMESVFIQTMKSKLSYPTSRDELAVDGNTYLFRFNKEENLSWEVWEPKVNSIPFKTAAICKEIAFSLKNNKFNELNIMDKINESGY